MRIYFSLLILCIASLLFSTKVQATETFFKGLGDLPDGEFGSSASAVSADGSVVVGSSSSKNGPEAFRWTIAKGIEGLGQSI